MTYINMILIFDLDDTLYQEIDYVKSGFKNVAFFLSPILKIKSEKIFEEMINILNKDGRGKVFDSLLDAKDNKNVALINKCLQIYRTHIPKIKLNPEADEIISKLGSKAYVVTDGNKLVQNKKINALKISNKFKKIFITHNYGVKNAKPSIHCFALIKKIESCKWNDMTYIGDNPYKDFVNLNPLGVNTIRLINGSYRNVKLDKKYEANYKINSLAEIFKII